MTDTTRSNADQLPVEMPEVPAQGSSATDFSAVEDSTTGGSAAGGIVAADSATGGPIAVAGVDRRFSLWHLFLMTACFALVMALRKDRRIPI